MKNGAVIERTRAALTADSIFPVALAFGEVSEVLGGDRSFSFKQTTDNLA